MESVYGTPISISGRTPRTTTARRRALSPNTPKTAFSSPYQIVDLDLESKEELKGKLLEAESIIQDLREERNKIHDDMISKAGLNESIIIETSNRVSTQETRIFKRDLTVLEEDLRQKQKQVRALQDQVAKLENSNQKMMEDLENVQQKQEETETAGSSLRDRIRNLEEQLYAKETVLENFKVEMNHQSIEFQEKIRVYESQIEVLERKLNVKTLKFENEKSEKLQSIENCEKLKKEIESLKKDRTEQMEMVKLSGDELSAQMRRSMEAENEQIATTRRVLNEVQQLSTQVQYLTPLRKPNPECEKSKEEYLKMSAKVIEENINDLRKRNSRLEKALSEKIQLLETTKDELDELKKSMSEAIGSSDKANKYLHEENSKLALQKADIRCELLEVKRSIVSSEEKIATLEKQRNEAVEEVKRLREEKQKVEKEMRVLEEISAKKEEDVEELQTKLAGMECLRRQNEDLKNEITKMQERLSELAKHLVMADKQCLQYQSLKETAEGSRRRAIQQCNEMVVKIRNLEASLENQRRVEQELNVLRADNERQAKKIEYLNEEIQETHIDYRDELAKLSIEKKENKIDESQNQLVTELRLSLSQRDSALRSSKKSIEELRVDNQKLTEQLSDVRKQQSQIVEENVKLRKGLADAVAKIEEYKRECENARDMSQRLAEELGDKEIKLNKMEEELHEKTEQVAESEQVVSYLHTQINVKPSKMPKLGRRSTLLNTVSEADVDHISYMREAEDVRELESIKEELMRSLEHKKRVVERKTAEANSVTHSSVDSGVQSKSASELSRPRPGTMRHDIPHKWKDVRHLSVLSLKCAICFIGIPTFGKAKKCSHCDVQVHAACASRVFNTCGMPTQCANFYRENHTTISSSALSEGRMNGWLRVYRDDQNTSTWISSWAMMNMSKVSFYTNDGADLDKPFFSIDLHREQWVVRAGTEMPVACEDQMRSSNVLMLKMPGRNIYLLAPSQNSARRWADCLNVAQKKRMMLTSKPLSMAEYTCLLVLNSPNNLKIFKAHAIDDWILFATQTGLFYTSISQPRNPMRIAGPSSVTSMEVMADINCLSMVTNSNGQLCIVPLDSLKLAMQSVQPSIRPDTLPEFQHVSLIRYHQQKGQRFLIVADSTCINILKYNANRDVYGHYSKITVKEPVICMESACDGFFFASDTFYYVPLSNPSNIMAHQLISPKSGDYPINVLVVGENELLLAYQNYGIFVSSDGKQTRKNKVEWEQMPMEFMYTSPYLFVIHYDSIQILEVADYSGYESKTILTDRECFECVNAHIIGKQHDGVLISLSSRDTTEVHRFNTSIGKRNNVTKRKGLSPVQTLKRTKN